MKVTFFIDRPVFSAVISIVIVIVGIIGLTMLPVDQYPQITPPVVKISASYPGASALTVSQAVATPIEQEINGTPGMLYMESNSSNSGGFSATVTFDGLRKKLMYHMRIRPITLIGPPMSTALCSIPRMPIAI